MIGVPPVGGFISKWFLLVGALDAAQIGIVVVLLTSTILNIGYFAPVVYSAFFGKPADPHAYDGLGEAPMTMVVPLLITAALSVAAGIYPDFFLNLIRGVFV